MPLDPVPEYPAALDTMPVLSSDTQEDEDGKEHDLLHNLTSAILEALQEKLGIGATTPDAIGKILMATAAGTTAWGYSGLIKIGETTGTGSSGVLASPAIPNYFRDIEITVVGRSSAAGTGGATITMTMEASPTSGAYDHQGVFAANTTVSAAENIGASDFINAGGVPTAGAAANLHGSSRIILPEYANTNMLKNAHVDAAVAFDLSSGNLSRRSFMGVWESTAAISTVRLTLSTGNWTTTSRMTVWGRPA